MTDLLPYLCPMSDCEFKGKMWGDRIDWATHLRNHHPISTAEGDDSGDHVFSCRICLQRFHIDDQSQRTKSIMAFYDFRSSHYAEHMERIAFAVLADYRPGESSSRGRQISRKRNKRHRRKVLGPEEEPMDGWSSDDSSGSRDEGSA